MLERLDAVDWSALRHAHGPATDTPAQLRALLSEDDEERENALDWLIGSVIHQGTVYSASAAVLPFLFELLREPAVQDRPSIAMLIAGIVSGRGYLEVHAQAEPERWRRTLAETDLSLERELAQEASVATDVRRTASPHMRELVPYLTDTDAEVRCSVASALGRFPEHEGWSRPALLAALDREQDGDVREAISQALLRLKGGNAG